MNHDLSKGAAERLADPAVVRCLEALRAASQAGGRSVAAGLAATPIGTAMSAGERLALLGAYFAYPVLDAAALDRLASELGPPAFDRFSLRNAMLSGCVLWRRDSGPWLAVLSDPLALRDQMQVEAAAGQPLDWRISDPEAIAVLLARYESTTTALPMASVLDVEKDSGAAPLDDISLASLGPQLGTAVGIVNSTLYDAHKAGASDIHLETDLRGLQIKYRLDGVLVRASEAPGAEIAAQVVSRLKVMSGLDIAERRVPQDGRFKARVRGREIDFRVSIMPSVFGEDAVIRILDKEQLAGSLRELRLDALGFDAGTLGVIRQLVIEPYGMFLVTGPTGSGKTTTLYAALTEINDGQEKIITIEDPVEYQVPGVLQIPVNEKKGLGFARGLRSILRHDPDKIMIGEIRDAETAEIAVQSALTGHLVLTTVHANNVFDVVGRFMHMGIDPYALVSALNGIVAQRLVRLNCPLCVRAATPDAGLLSRSGIERALAAGWTYQTGTGCTSCRGTGYKGRLAVAETLIIDDRIRDLIVNRASVQELKLAAANRGTRSLRAAVLDLVAAGRTSLPEANRVTSMRDELITDKRS